MTPHQRDRTTPLPSELSFVRRAIGLACLLASALRLLSADLSGVSPQAISLPSGPGSLEGLGEKFQPQLNSGTFTYEVPFSLPPVRGGAPALALSYNSGNENGMIGLGWSLRIPCVRRQTDKGLPQYTNTDLFCDENAEELVHISDGCYRQKIEGAFIRYEPSTTNSWLGRLPDGSTVSFGSTPGSHLDWSENRTFVWMLDSSEDRNGNRVEYDYLQDGQQIYPSAIRYGLHRIQATDYYTIQFSYSTNRPDPFVDCRPRFICTTALRLQAITVYLGTRRVREWRLGYDTTSSISLLTSIAMYGDERSDTSTNGLVNVDYLPPTQFAYTPYTVQTSAPVQSINLEPNFSFGEESGFSGAGGPHAEFVDINHDGLPDLIINNPSNPSPWRSLVNPGPFTSNWPPSLPIGNVPAVTGAALGTPNTRLVDLRGDGRAKLLLAEDGQPGDPTAFFYYDFLTPSALSTNGRRYDTLNGITLGDGEVQFVDLDNDKAMDVIRLNTSGPFIEALYTRNYEGLDNDYERTPMPAGALPDFTQGWKLADMNGDHLQDLVVLQGRDSTEVCLNLGWGQFAAPYWMSGGPEAWELDSTGNSGPYLVDLNQDGLADLVIVYSGLVRVWLNVNGQRWADPIDITTNVPSFQVGEDAVRFADINGNGSIDIIWHHGQDPELRYLDLFPNGKGFLLNHVETSLGSKVDIAYRSSTDFMSEALGTAGAWTSTAPFPVPVMSQEVQSDGLGNSYTNYFSYRNAYYDPLEHQFRGFEEATQTEVGDDSQGAPTLVTMFEFSTGETNEAMKGKVLRLEADTTDGGVFYRQTNEWVPRPLALLVATGETRSVTFAFQNHQVTQEIELGSDTSAVTLEQEFDFDNFGNQVFHADYGRVENGDRSAWNDERLYVRQFSAEYPNNVDSGLWILNRLVQEETMDLRSNVVARTQVFYDDPLFAGNNLGSVSRGNPTLTLDWIDITNNISRQSLRHEFDVFGNVTGIYDPLGVPGRFDLGHYRHIDFDSSLHTHPVKEAIYTANPDAIASDTPQPSLVVHAAYDLGLGVITSATDFSGNPTLFSFDTFGRLATITKPYDTTNFPTAVFGYMLRVPIGGGQTINSVSTSLRETNGQEHTYDSRSFSDGLGRKVMTRSASETNGVVVVSGGALFNQRQGVWRSFLPYFETGSLDFSPLVTAGPYIEDRYDALGRVIETSQPPTAADNHRAHSSTSYSPLVRFVQNEEQTLPAGPHRGAGMRYTEDGLRDQNGKGRLRCVEEVVKITDDGLVSMTTNTWRTQYTYDVLDDFLGYTDSQGNKKEFRWDALRRKTFMNDPDRGIMRWFYDQASNVTNSIDGKGQQILYAFDGANRLLTERYQDGLALPPWRLAAPNPAVSSSFNVLYHYDIPLANVPVGDGTLVTPSNTLGRLAWVEDLSGEEHTSFDARGRVALVIKRIPDPQLWSLPSPSPAGLLVSYGTGFVYDSLDRVQSLTYPDNDVVTYAYNSRNLLDGILGGTNGLTRRGAVVEKITYRASGQLDSITYGNGVITHHDYDPRLRLSSLTTAPPTNPASFLMAFSYDYDDASTIHAIHDNRPTGVVPAENQRRNSQFFGYDDLYRITSAGYALGGPGASSIDGGSISYRYDRIGNMLEQTSSINATDPLNRLPLVNLGTMVSGGSASGRSNRNGRAANDVAGPHALTSIHNPSPGVADRGLVYDANGNLNQLDGQVAIWDFKDRLIGLENPQMRADYVYDYTGRRIIKRVNAKTGVTNLQSFTTLYVGKHFEVREHDAPTKFIFNGPTRVARVVGSLSSNPRIQRIRLFPGWNLISFAVAGSLAGTWDLTPSPILSALRWQPANLAWAPISISDQLPAGAVLWVKASTNATLQLTGTYPGAPGPISAGPEGAFLSGPGLEVLAFTNQPTSLQFWQFLAGPQTWEWEAPPPISLELPAPTAIAPGQAFFARAPTASDLQLPDFSLDIKYYHQDHLGSSSCITDTGGNLIEDLTFYPFGEPRTLYEPRGQEENYQYAQKERDLESHLDYFESRYLWPSVGRFASVDPIIGAPSPQSYPQRLCAYSYAYNSPLRFSDPTGQTGEEVANWWQERVDTATRYYTASPGNWVWNGTITTFGTIIGGLADPLRLGSDAGRIIAQGGSPQQIAMATVQETLRVAAIVPAWGAGVDLLKEPVEDLVASAAKSAAAERGLTNPELIRKAGQKAFDRIQGKGGVVGIQRHKYATKLLERYQAIYGDRGLRFAERRSLFGQKSILDARDINSKTIYDWKFGDSARMSPAQRAKYQSHYPDHTIQVEQYR